MILKNVMSCNQTKKQKRGTNTTTQCSEGLVTSKAHFLPKDHELLGTGLGVHSL